MKNNLFLILILTLLYSCGDKKEIADKSGKMNTINKVIEWDFANKDFPQSDLTFIAGGYNAFQVRKINEKTMLLQCTFFQSWKNKPVVETDTLILKTKKFEKDTKGNVLSQKLTYSKDNEVKFKLNVTLKNVPVTDSLSGKPKLFFTYGGKLKVNKKNRQYLNDDLWYK